MRVSCVTGTHTHDQSEWEGYSMPRPKSCLGHFPHTTLNKSFYFSGHQFPQQQNGENGACLGKVERKKYVVSAGPGT